MKTINPRGEIFGDHTAARRNEEDGSLSASTTLVYLGQGQRRALRPETVGCIVAGQAKGHYCHL
jgi:hypothetical protein